MGARRSLKLAVRGAAAVAVFPILAAYALLGLVSGGDGLFWSFSQFLSLLPGKTGSFLRVAFYRFAMSRCSPDCAILFGTIFSHADTEIGRGVYIGPQCNIGSCRIEDDCTLGSGVHVLSGKGQHRFDDPETPIREQGGTFEKVTIGEDTWVGNGALILAHVGRKCVVGAGAVVTREVEDFSIVAGNPARVIGSRKGREP